MPTRARAIMSTPGRWWSFVLAGLGYGVLTALSLPPVGLWPLALIALAPLVWAGCSARVGALGGRRWGALQAALLAALGTVPLWLVESVWLINVSAPGYPLIALYLAVYPALFVWAVAQARTADWPIPMAVVVPVLWTALEVLKGEVVFTGYAWYLLGQPVIDSPAMAAPAALLGAYAVSFLCAAVAGALADAGGWAGVPRSWGGVGALAIAAAWTAGSVLGERSTRPEGPATTLRVGVVQTNLPQDNKLGWSMEERLRDMRAFLDMTGQCAAQKPTPELIVWPETMFPGPALNPGAVADFHRNAVEFVLARDAQGRATSTLAANAFHDQLVDVQGGLGIPMIVGCVAVEGEAARSLAGADRASARAARYNSAVLVAGGRATESRYDKIDLTPFGEVIPYVWRWPALQQWMLNIGAAGMRFDLAAGARAGGIDVPVERGPGGARAVRIATPICFEATRAALCRRLVAGESGGGEGAPAAMLLNLSNDGWFGWWDPGRRQHLLAARWRCVELGVPMVRAVNTGVSCAIDRRGVVTAERLIDRAGPTERAAGVMVAPVELRAAAPSNLFRRVGLGPAYAVLALGLLGAVALWFRALRSTTVG